MYFWKRFVIPPVLMAWVFSSFIVRSALAEDWCHNALDLEPNGVWRSEVPVDGSTFRWRLPDAGIVTIDLLTPDAVPAWIDLRAGDCDGRASQPWIIEQSANRLVLAVKAAGDLYLASSAVLAPFRLVSTFTMAEVVEEAWTLGSTRIQGLMTSFLAGDSSGRKAEPEIFDPDPDGLAAGGDQSLVTFLSLERPSASISPTNRQVFDVALREVLLFEPACGRPGLDDHGDIAGCATRVSFGREITGELSNAWRDDSDLFWFEVAEVSNVEFTVSGEIPALSVELEGASGERLPLTAQKTEGQPLESGGRLGAILAPGRYFFRISGDSGAYSLTVRADD